MPAEIVFQTTSEVDLPVLGHATIKAYVLDTNGHRLNNATVDWRLADPELEPFVLVGPNTNNQGVNSVVLTWLGGRAGLKYPTDVKLVATSGPKARAFATIHYKAPAPEVTKLTTEVKEIRIQPGEVANVDVTVHGEDGRLLKDIELNAEIADPNARKFFLVTTEKQTVKLVGLFGDDKNSDPFVRTALSITAAGKSKLLTVPVIMVREAASVDYWIVPPNIVGDNYGRTIRNDYYCIGITIQNNSGGDLALATLRFTGGDRTEAALPNSNYAIAHGSLLRRKLTHPRSMTLAIIDGAGTLLTGFNPFFHNVYHAKNYSQFIDIISNPLAKGLDKAWKDSYPDELMRFEQDVLHDDKIIPSNGILKAIIFVAKRDLFTNEEKSKRIDLKEVRKALGTLEVRAYKFQKGDVQTVGSSK